MSFSILNTPKLHADIFISFTLIIFNEFTDQSNGECFISETEINSLKLTKRPGVAEPHLENLEMDPFLTNGKLSVSSSEKHNETSYKNVIQYSSASENKVRRKRENDIIKAEAYTDKDGHRKNVVNMVRYLYDVLIFRVTAPSLLFTLNQ